MITAVGVSILVAAGVWIFGGLLARWIGALLVVAAAAGLASTNDPGGLFLLMLGAALWLAGHMLYRMRRASWKSVLVERLCLVRFSREPEDRW
jgi:hypothetical protein